MYHSTQTQGMRPLSIITSLFAEGLYSVIGITAGLFMAAVVLEITCGFVTVMRVAFPVLWTLITTGRV
jgi:hypothetical protein